MMTTESPGSPVFHPAATSCARSSRTAGGYTAAGSTATRLDPGQSATVTVVNEARPGSLVLRKTDDAGQLLAGACFALRSGDRVVYSICDNDASDATPASASFCWGRSRRGHTRCARSSRRRLSRRRRPGNHHLREPAEPDQRRQPSAGTAAYWRFARLQARHRRPRAGRLLLCPCRRRRSGARAALRRGRRRRQRRSPDGRDRAREYTLRETRRPSADYQTAADVLVEIAEDQTVDVEVVNRLHPGRILIRKIDPNGVPLAGACFDLVEDGAGASCTDENGELLFAALVPGVYSVMETEAPRATSTRRQSTQSRSGLAARRHLTSSTSRHRRHRTAARSRSGNSSAP